MNYTPLIGTPSSLASILCAGAISLTAALDVRAAITVRGEASSTGHNITVRITATITDTPIMSFGIRLLYRPDHLQVVSVTENTNDWFLLRRVKPIAYHGSDPSLPGQVTIIGARLDQNNPLAGNAGTGILLGTVRFTRLSPQAPQFTLQCAYSPPFANFVTSGLEVVDPLVEFTDVYTDPDDEDLDGLHDAWEKTFFGSPDLAYFCDDPDGDRISNIDEQALGTDPTDPESTFSTQIKPTAEGSRILWKSVQNRTYRLERSTDLRSFEVLVDEIAANPPINEYAVPYTGHTMFYRVALVRNIDP